MLLSELIGKNVYVGKTFRGVLRGVCLSLKTCQIKYLLCRSDTAPKSVEFAVGVGSVEGISDAVYLKRIRAVVPRGSVRFVPERPVYFEDGAYLGVAADLVLDGFSVLKLLTDLNRSYSAASITALGDAVLLKREPLFPLGRVLPKAYSDGEKASLVSRATLKNALQKGHIIRLTASVLPAPYTAEL